jgi:transposase, IS6 family
MGDSRLDRGRCAASKQLRSTRAICAGHAFIQNVRRGHYKLGSDTDPKKRLTTAFTGLTLVI